MTTLELIQLFNLVTLTYSLTKDKYEYGVTFTFKEDDLYSLVRLDKKEFYQFLKKIQIIRPSAACPTCGQVIENLLFSKGGSPSHRCGKRHDSRKKISALKNTIFEGSKLEPQTLFKIIWWFNCRRVNSDAYQTLEITDKPVAEIYYQLRAGLFYFIRKYSCKLGGEGVTVHLDETALTKPHGDKGKRVRSQTVWIIGAVDVINKKAFLEFLPSRGHVDTLPFVTDNIEEGSTVHTDCLATYRILSEMGYVFNR